MDNYSIPYSLLGNCFSKVSIEGHEISTHYLNLLEQHDNIAKHIQFSEASKVFEIGGGFGTNIHLLLENYKNIRKIIYLDIPPNLYVGTQYLKSFYGDAVLDYKNLKDLDSIKFSEEEKVEIFCITPWQIEKIEGPIDIFMNSHSFVEIPKIVIENYVNKMSVNSLSTNTAIALTAYDRYDLNTTSDPMGTHAKPENLPDFFPGRKFKNFEVKQLFNSSRKNLFFVSPGKFSFS